VFATGGPPPASLSCGVGGDILPRFDVRVNVGSSGHLSPPSPPAEKTTARKDQAGDLANAITVPKAKAC